MSQSSTPDLKVDGSQASTSTSAPAKYKRRGKGSRNKASEKFRGDKNESQGKPVISDRISTLNLQYGVTPEDLFGALCLDLALVKPVHQIVITTHKLAHVCRLTVETLLDACKVPTVNRQRDIETVQLVASLQLFAKMYYAKSNTPYSDPIPYRQVLAERVYRHCDQCILPIATFIDQIGAVDVNGQKFIPDDLRHANGNHYTFNYVHLSSRAVYQRENYPFLRDLPTNARTGDLFHHLGDCERVLDNGRPVLGPHGGEMFVWVHDPNLFDPAHVQPFYPVEVAEYVELVMGVALPTPDDIFPRYFEFLTRCQKKVAFEKFPLLNLKRGVGTAAQLVGVGRWVNEFRDVYCSRDVPASAMFISAAFELGLYEQTLTDPDCALIRSNVDSRNAIERMMRCLTQRVERK